MAELNPSVLASLGVTQEQILDLIIQKISDDVIADVPAGDLVHAASRKVKELIGADLDKAVTAAIGSLVNDKIRATLDELTLNPTTRWGEKRGEPLTFAEYATKKADEYCQQMVDIYGKPTDGYSSPKMPRLAWLIDKHLDTVIERLVKESMGDFNKQALAALNQTVALEVGKIYARLKAQGGAR